MTKLKTKNSNNTIMPKYAILKVLGIISLLALVLIPVLVLMAQLLSVDITVVSNEFMMLQSLVYAIGIIFMIFIVSRSMFTFHEIGFRRPENTRKGLYFLVLAIANMIYLLVLWLTTDIRGEVTIVFILINLVFNALVAVLEELVFRGLIYRYLLKFGVSKAILFSSILFGVGHLAGTITGVNSPVGTMIQISNAFLFGWAAVSLVVVTKSLWPVIIWHFLFNYLSIIFEFDLMTLSGLAFMIANVIFNAAFAMWLRPQIKRLTHHISAIKEEVKERIN